MDIQRRFRKVQGIQRYRFYLFLSCIWILAHKPPIGSITEKEKYYASIAKHQYLIWYLIKLNTQRKFRKVQGIQRYRFYLFLSCIQVLAHEPPIGSITEKEKYYASIAKHQYLIQYLIKLNTQRRFRKVQGIQRYRFYLFLLCIRILAHEPPIGSITEKEKYYASIAKHQYLIWYLIKLNTQRKFRKVQGIQRYRFYLFLSCIQVLAHEPPIGSITEKEKYYASIAKHQYLIQYLIKVDIQRIFGKVQGIQRYWFYLFLSCNQILAHKPPIGSITEKEKYYTSIAKHKYLIRYFIKMDIQRRFGKVQGIQWYRFYLLLSCIWILAHKPSIGSITEKEKYYEFINKHQYLIWYLIKVDIKRRFRKVQGIQRYRFYLFLSCIQILAHKPPIGSITEKEKYYASIANH